MCMCLYWDSYSVFGFVNFLLDLLHRLHRPHNLLLYQIVAPTVAFLGITLLRPQTAWLPLNLPAPLENSIKNYKRKQVDNMANSCPASTFQFSSVFLSVEAVEPPCPALLPLRLLPLCALYGLFFVVLTELKIAAGEISYYPRLKPPTAIVASASDSGSGSTCVKSCAAYAARWKNSRSATRARYLHAFCGLKVCYA